MKKVIRSIIVSIIFRLSRSFREDIYSREYLFPLLRKILRFLRRLISIKRERERERFSAICNDQSTIHLSRKITLRLLEKFHPSRGTLDGKFVPSISESIID